MKTAALPVWFILGREPLLSTAEIFSVLHVSPNQPSSALYMPPILRIETKNIPSHEPPPILISHLGGTVKIGQEIAANLPEEQIIPVLFAELKKIDGKINFGISFCAPPHITTSAVPTIDAWAKTLKTALKNAGRSVRFISSDLGSLSSATVFHNKLIDKGREFLIMLGKEHTFSIAVTKAVQPLEEFSARDFGRPGRDDRSGMLPPKLALMMLNLATDHLLPSSFSILDPFCGSGTILTEALRLGYTHLTGTDISAKAILDTKRNVEWIRSKSPKGGGIRSGQTSNDNSMNIFQSDIHTLSAALPPQSIDAVITEPYLGPPLKGRESPEHIKKTCAELADLYVKAFEQFKIVLKPGGVVVFIIPRFTIHPSDGLQDTEEMTRETRFTISDRIIPKLKNLGFTKERLLPESFTPASYVLYHRPSQRVGREIWKFRFA